MTGTQTAYNKYANDGYLGLQSLRVHEQRAGPTRNEVKNKQQQKKRKKKKNIQLLLIGMQRV